MDQDGYRLQEELNIDIATMIHDILSNWWAILLGALAAVMLTYVAVNESYVPEYTARATFVVGSKGDFNAATNLTSTNSMAQTFQRILKSNVMKKILCEEMGVKELTEQIDAKVVENTNLLVLTVTADSPKEAIDLIHAVMDNYTQVSYYTAGDAVMDVLEEPSIPMNPDNPLNIRNYVKKVFLIAIIGLSGLFGLISYMRDTIKQEDDIEKKLDARNMGTIPYERKKKTFKEFIKRKKKTMLVSDSLAGFTYVESFKKMAIKVDYQMAKENRKVLVITSVSENEGKSTIAANLAICLAEQSKKVLLLDGDFRRPSQFLIFEKNVAENQEIGEVIKGSDKASLSLVNSSIPGLYLLLGRNCYSSSTELVHSKRMKQIIDICRKNMDYIIIDSPPTGLLGDAEALAEYADAVMLTVKQNFIYAEDINDALDSFREHHSKVLGVVLNNVKSIPGLGGKSFYGHYGKYGHYRNYRKSRER